MLTDIEISRAKKTLPITRIAKKLGLKSNQIECYGNSVAKVNYETIKMGKKGKLILVTAINPTPAGEGKTTVSIGLADALCNCLNKKTCLALREPSLGPVFGIKGGATGGGYSQVAPMEEINLHFTGDMHAITSSNNLLSAIIDNHIHQGNKLDIVKVYHKRCLDLNDRALKSVTLANDRKDFFTITSASEVMAILAVSRDLKDLKKRLGNILVGENSKGEYIFARDLKAENAMTILLKNAIKPNLVQTLEGTPALIHCGPFANIAHGCNSVVATNAALSLADYVVTEAGFGADLGAEKFLDFKCQMNGLNPDVIVLVATIRALKMHGGESKDKLKRKNLNALQVGFGNLERHINNIKNVYKANVVVAINKFDTDTDDEINKLKEMINSCDVESYITEGFMKGGKGCKSLAKAVINKCKTESNVDFVYSLEDDIKTKIKKVVTKIYGADNVEYTTTAFEKIKQIESSNFKNLPIIIAKTQYSFSDKKELIGAPSNFNVKITDVEIKSGAGFIVIIAGNMLLMPGLAEKSAYLGMKIDEHGAIDGLF